jgi:hypothetical protein
MSMKNSNDTIGNRTRAYNIKCKWENEVKKGELRLGGGKGGTRLYVGSIGYKYLA